jgi:DegV family protein with EDD domain
MSKEIKIAIVTDSNSGLLEKNAPKGVFVLPMPFLINGEPYLENINLTQEEFYQLLDAQTNVSTSQPSIGDVTDLWTELLKEYDEIVHIPMSSGLSQSCATAENLAKEFSGKVFVVDNHRISVNLKHSIMDAVKLRAQGKSGTEMKKYLEETAFDGSIYIAVDTMKYLKKGGRVTPAAAMIGTILKLKPILQIHGDKLDKYALPRNMLKAKDVMKQAVKEDIENAYAKYAANGELELSVAYTDNKAEGERFVEEIKAFFPNIHIRFCEPLSLSISCHIGPGALGVAITRVLL